jgi:hypothetical protein
MSVRDRRGPIAMRLCSNDAVFFRDRMKEELSTTRSEYARRDRHFSIQLVLPRTVRLRCLGCQECQSKSKTGHLSSAPACDLYAFLVTVQ